MADATPADFATVVLQGLGAPVTQNNITNMEIWMSAEGGTAQNPLNVRQSNGGFAIATQQEGAQQTFQVLSQSNMAPIKAALMADSSLSAFTAAVISTPWDAGHYAGTGFAAGTDKPLTSFSAGVTGDILSTLSMGVVGPGSAVDTGVDKAATAVGTETTFWGDITSKSFWDRIGIFALGGTIFGISLLVFMANTKAGSKAISSGEQAGAMAALA